MLIDYEISKGIIIIHMGNEKIDNQLTGEVSLDTKNSHLLDNIFEELIPKGHFNYVLDLQNISYVYSYGISVIVNTYKYLLERDGMIKILNPSSFVSNLLDTLKMFSIFDVFEDKKKAVKSFKTKSLFK